jgi:D-lyxose ketol-isomerase
MISLKEYLDAREAAAKMIREAGIVISDKEVEEMDVADFGLSNLRMEGAQIVSLINTDKVAARVIAQFPGQTEPEHWHTGFGGYEGKQETLRVIRGELYLCLPGEDTLSKAVIPAGKEAYYTVRHEIIMRPTDTVTIPVGRKHWFQAGRDGAVFYTMSTLAADDKDPFTDPHMVRKTVIKD